MDIDGFDLTPAQVAGLDQDIAATRRVFRSSVETVRAYRMSHVEDRITLFVGLARQFSELDALKLAALVTEALLTLTDADVANEF